MIEIEAPAKELFVYAEPAVGAGVELTAVAHRLSSRGGELPVLRELNLAARPGEIVGVVGPSGCGKSTLLELISGLQQPSEGSVAVGGSDRPHDRLARCALMPQRDLLLPWRSALANAALPLELAGVPRARARERVAPLLEQFGLEGFGDVPPYELSGGMRQRVAFLRTLVAGKPVLLLDEPFGSLDTITRADMQEWLAEALLHEPRTVVLVSHDVEEALFLCDRVTVLSRRPGRVVAEIPVELARPRHRRRTVVAPEFVALRERALEALS